MAVAKRQGRSEDQSEDFSQNKQHSWLSPICIGQAQVEEKKHIKEEPKRFLTDSLSRVHERSLSFSLFLPPHALLHSLLFQSWILLLSSK